jgi:hypothetical protein
MFASTSFSRKVEMYNALTDVLLLLSVLVYTIVCQYTYNFLKKGTGFTYE